MQPIDADPKDKVLNPTVVKLGMVSLFADIASEMLYPVTPIFLTAVLGASMTSLGIVEGVAEALASLLKTYAGAWSDRTGKRKPFIVYSYLVSAIAKPMIGLATAWPGVLFARSLDRTGKAFRSGPRDALLSEAVNPRLLGAAFGWHRAMDTLGAAIGPLLAVVYLNYVSATELRPLFYWSLIPGLIAVLFAMTLRERAAATKTAPVKRPWSELSAPFKHYLLAWGVFSVVNSSDAFLLLKTKQSGVSTTVMILIYCFYNLVYASASPSLGQLSDRIGRKSVLCGGFLVFALVYAGIAFAHEPWHYWTLFAIYGLYMAATDGVGKAFAIDLVDPATKATGVGILGTVTGLSTLVASVIAGILWDHLGEAAPFVVGAVGSTIAAFLLSCIPTNKQN